MRWSKVKIWNSISFTSYIFNLDMDGWGYGKQRTKNVDLVVYWWVSVYKNLRTSVLVSRPPSNTSGILVDKEPPFPCRSRIQAHSQKLTWSWRSISLYVRVSDVFCSGSESRNTSSVLECKLYTIRIHYVQYQGVVGAFRSFTKYMLWIHREKSPDGGESEREGAAGAGHLMHGVYSVPGKPGKRQTSILKR